MISVGGFLFFPVLSTINTYNMRTSNTYPFLHSLLILTTFLSANTVFAQDQAPKPKFQMGIKASWLYCDPIITKPASTYSTLLGFSPVNGYDVGFYVNRNLNRRLQISGQIGHTLQGRRSPEARYNHFMAYAELGAKAKVLHPLSVEMGFRAGGTIADTDDWDHLIKKGDVGLRLGVGVHLYKGLSLHADYLRSFNKVLAFEYPGITHYVRRSSIGIGLSYDF